MIPDLKDKKLLAFIVLIALFCLVIYYSLPFFSAFFGALVLFVLFRPINHFLMNRFNISKNLSVSIIIVLSLLIVIIPLLLLIQGVVGQLSILPQQITQLNELESTINSYIPGLNVSLSGEKIIQEAVPFLRSSLSSTFSSITFVLLSLLIMYFVLYYLLIDEARFMKKVHSFLPFSLKNSQKITAKFSDITYATIVGTIIIAIVQGGLLALTFFFLDIPGALFWGFVAAILAIIPVLGTPVIWIPAAIILFIQGYLAKAIILIIAGIIISTSDNFIRPITNKKFGRIHPLISVIGVLIGITQFGFMGIFVGPLLISYLLLFWEIYKEEYLSD